MSFERCDLIYGKQIKFRCEFKSISKCEVFSSTILRILLFILVVYNNLALNKLSQGTKVLILLVLVTLGLLDHI